MLTFLTVLLLVVLSRVFNQEGKRFLDWLSVFPLLFSNDNYYTLESGIPARPHIGRCSGNFDQEPGARPECTNALCKRDVGAGGQNLKKVILHTFFIE